MCSVGGGDFNLEVEELEAVKYKCKDCGNVFEAIGEAFKCPACKSTNVVRA
ncbi:MAG: hydrogenase maturation nickel metallochaperone HypA [Candidatus Methanospirare jalkutatii]|nr:hydrogenase maturation nickel metallochaperone HypA [Candidatus Methanospirare jalkutatii]UYZ39426.1 MAG: hydrogenase maturation nickel metallochaperone HypA [Candidatus Methanospirare jalkutatii]UYZ40418.1 MAG: hydrogenase maturation nickel metallochaperone HypA [Candidatus Methanospirare jalkutatii]